MVQSLDLGAVRVCAWSHPNRLAVCTHAPDCTRWNPASRQKASPKTSVWRRNQKSAFECQKPNAGDHVVEKPLSFRLIIQGREINIERNPGYLIKFPFQLLSLVHFKCFGVPRDTKQPRHKGSSITTKIFRKAVLTIL